MRLRLIWNDPELVNRLQYHVQATTRPGRTRTWSLFCFPSNRQWDWSSQPHTITWRMLCFRSGTSVLFIVICRGQIVSFLRNLLPCDVIAFALTMTRLSSKLSEVPLQSDASAMDENPRITSSNCGVEMTYILFPQMIDKKPELERRGT